MRALKQSTARDLMVFMTLASDHVTGATGLTLTITASKSGAAFASISPAVTDRGSGWYSLALTTSHTDTLGDFALHVTGAAADPADLLCQVVAYDFGDATRLGLSALPNAAAEASGGIVTRGTGAGQITVSSGAVTVGTNNDKTGYTASTVSDKTGYSLASPQTVDITGNITGNVSGSVGSVSGAVGSVTGNVGGNVAGSVASVTAGVTLANDSVTAAALAASAVTEIQSGISALDAAGVRAAVGLASANLDTQLAALPTASENADAVWDETAEDHETAGTTGEALSTAGAGGATLYGESGSVEFTYTVYDTNGTTPLENCAVYASSDLAGTNRSQAKLTDALGRVQFTLIPGTVYFWRSHATRSFSSNPDIEDVS